MLFQIQFESKAWFSNGRSCAFLLVVCNLNDKMPYVSINDKKNSMLLKASNASQNGFENPSTQWLMWQQTFLKRSVKHTLYCKSRQGISATDRIAQASIKPPQEIDPCSPGLDDVSGLWKRHLTSNTLRRVSASLQSDKITQKTFRGTRAAHRGRERERNSGLRGKAKCPLRGNSPASSRVRESRRREHSLWQQFELSSPIPSSAAGRREKPPPNTHGWRGYNGCRAPQGRPWGVHVWHPEEIRRSVTWEIPFHPRVAGSEMTAVFRTFPATVLCAGREERRKKRSRTGHHSGTSTRCRGRHCSSRVSHVGVARSPFHSTRSMVVSQHWSSQAWRHRASPALE